MLHIRLTLDTRKSSCRADGTFPVVVRVPFGKHPVDIHTGLYSSSCDWDDRTALYTGKGATKVNSALSVLLSGVQQRALELHASGRWASFRSHKALRLALSGASDVSAPSDDVVSYMTAQAEAKQRAKTKESYLLTALKIREYTADVPLSFDDLTIAWLRKFEAWLLDTKHLSVNSVGIYMRNLRAVVNRAIDDDLTSVYGFRRFSIRRQATRHRALTADELRAFLSAPVTPAEAEYRDIFLLGFLLLGINLADLSRVSDIEQGRICYRRSKTGKLYSVKVEPEALAIIDRYRGVSHLLRQFDAYSSYVYYAQHLNRYLKHIGATTTGRHGKCLHAPLFPDISYYWCRHSWASIASSIGVPEDTIRHALGHGARSVTDTYIDYDLRHVDEANRCVIDAVLGPLR